MKSILVINAHPSSDSLSATLANAYATAAKAGGFNIDLVHLSDLKFDPVLHKGYKSIQTLEPDLVQMQTRITAAAHVVFVFPVWWGSVPALFKGFLDRTLLPGYAFKYRTGSPMWDKLLAGRTARIIVTSDGPIWWNRFIFKDSTINMMKKAVLEFCGFKVKVTQMGSVKTAKPQQIQKFISKIAELGRAGE